LSDFLADNIVQISLKTYLLNYSETLSEKFVMDLGLFKYYSVNSSQSCDLIEQNSAFVD
jgi:hypothetical protein